MTFPFLLLSSLKPGAWVRFTILEKRAQEGVALTTPCFCVSGEVKVTDNFQARFQKGLPVIYDSKQTALKLPPEKCEWCITGLLRLLGKEQMQIHLVAESGNIQNAEISLVNSLFNL